MQSIGDLAQSLALGFRQTRLKTDIDRLGVELSTGLAADKAARLNGDTTTLQSVEHALRRLDAFRIATTEAGIVSESMQRALDIVQTGTQDLTASLLRAGLLVTDSARATLSNDAAETLQSVISALNTQAAGRVLFAGIATDTVPLTNARELVADLVTHVGGATDVAGIDAALDDWFDTPGGGFETTTYRGATEDLQPLELREGVTVSLAVRADDGTVRAILKAAAKAALVNEDALALDPDVKTGLLVAAGRDLAALELPLTELRATLGLAEGRIEQTSVRNASEVTSLEIARLNLVGTDPYETAIRLEQAELQLRSLYTATARASRLSLLEYIR
ncbi:flagellin [Roseivivax isoporae]|uniref:Flagellar hook protein FlgL n=1 Tax=Roseivivax isoporae LMG 25204 TaxID=1449351 RepID=X7FC60_9RHOB|nr:flagellin [Roseivivax isoporae]ETX29681.1 flagellar hook protein FlgL [Roseivivax isoporae LMG 25204]